jgi:hypothetical protein
MAHSGDHASPRVSIDQPSSVPQISQPIICASPQAPYVAGLCHVTTETPHHRTLSAPDKQRFCDSCNLLGNRSSLSFSHPVEGKPLIGNCLPRVCGAVTVQVAVPMDSSLQCVALVRGLPATRALMMVRLTWCKANARQTPGGRHRSVSASSPLPSQNVCAPRLHCALEAVVRLGTSQCALPRILKQCKVRVYELRTPGAYSLVATDGFNQMPPIRFCTARGPRTLMALGALAALRKIPSVPLIRPKYFFTNDGRIFCVPYAYRGSYRLAGENRDYSDIDISFGSSRNVP